MSEEMEKGLKLRVKFKIADVWRYNYYIAYQSIASKVLVLLGVALLVGLGYRMQNRTVDLDIFITQNVVWIILPIFILIVTPWKVWKITAVQMQVPAFANGVEYEFYADKIILKVQETIDEIPWETYSRIVETKKDFRFFVDKVQAQILPKHNMTQEQIIILKDLIKQANPSNIYQLK